MTHTLFTKQNLKTARKLVVSLALATPLMLSSVATQAASADSEESSDSSRYELSRSDTMLLLNIDADIPVQENVNFLHLENVYTGQTYRLKMRSGTHLLKMEAGVYRADLERMGQQFYSDSNKVIDSSSTTEITLMPQSVNFAGTWHFEADGGKSASLTIENSNNPAVAVAKKYPVLANYQLRTIKGNSSQLASIEWPFTTEEMLSLRK